MFTHKNKIKTMRKLYGKVLLFIQFVLMNWDYEYIRLMTKHYYTKIVNCLRLYHVKFDSSNASYMMMTGFIMGKAS
jgi:hypothetical protein